MFGCEGAGSALFDTFDCPRPCPCPWRPFDAVCASQSNGRRLNGERCDLVFSAGHRQ